MCPFKAKYCVCQFCSDCTDNKPCKDCIKQEKPYRLKVLCSTFQGIDPHIKEKLLYFVKKEGED